MGYAACFAYCNLTSGHLSMEDLTSQTTELSNCYFAGVKDKFGNQTSGIISPECWDNKKQENSGGMRLVRIGLSGFLAVAVVIGQI
jgi:hypothetical protein